jgi:predicted acyl esterase
MAVSRYRACYCKRRRSPPRNRATANQFKAGHRICLDITSMDVPTGTGAMTNVEYIPYHVCSSKTVTHKIYRDAERPSHLLLPIIPKPADQRPA